MVTLLYKTLVQVALQNLNATAYRKHKFFVIPDPALNIVVTTPFLLEAKVNKISLGVNEQIGICSIEFPNRKFGTHVGYGDPIAVALDNANNIVYRGFLCVENANLDDSTDQISVDAYDYKWLLGKLSKIRGKIYTVDNYVKPDKGSALNQGRVFSDERLFEKFRYVVPDPSTGDGVFNRGDATGFIGNMRTIFNEDGLPDCASPDINSNRAVAFKMDQDPFYIEFGRFNARRGDDKFWWNYATILLYVAQFYIESVFNPGFFSVIQDFPTTTKVQLNRDSLVRILRFGAGSNRPLIIPRHFDITGLSPVQAIDKIVKAIPGSWFWRLKHYSNTVEIDIQNLNDPDIGLGYKSLFIGDGGKINDTSNNNVNVKSCQAHRSIVDSISHAVACGGAIYIESSFQYIPGWTQYIRPTTDFASTPIDDDSNFSIYEGGEVPAGFYVSNFKNPGDYKQWRQYSNKITNNENATTKKLSEVIVGEEVRYAKIFRVFLFPEAKRDITRFSDISLTQFFDDYEGYATFLHELVFTHLIRVRKILGPSTNYKQERTLKTVLVVGKNEDDVDQIEDRKIETQPFVFLYDELAGETEHSETGVSAGLTLEIQQILDARKFIIPDNSSSSQGEEDDLNYSIEYENRMIVFDKPQYERRAASFVHLGTSSEPEFSDGLTSRKVFMTCKVECDVPIVRDLIKNRNSYSGARLVSQDIDENSIAVIRVKAYYPPPEGYIGDSLTFEESGDTQTGYIVNEGPYGQDSVSTSRLIDWNRVDRDSAEAALIIDDRDQLKQMVEIMLGQSPIYEETFNVDLGRVDASFNVGDRVGKIIGSELEDGTGGYYNMKALIETLEHSKVGDTDAYTTTMNIRNNIPPTQPVMEERRT